MLCHDDGVDGDTGDLSWWIHGAFG